MYLSLPYLHWCLHRQKTADMLGELCCDWSGIETNVINMWNNISTIQYTTVVYCTESTLTDILNVFSVLHYSSLYFICRV